ncbi:MAG: transcription antitermination factor NusB [Chitinophagaceae bacterium]
MISRRNIRVKVMQTLYTVSSLENDVKPREPRLILKGHFKQTRSLLIYLTWFLTEVSRYAETDSHQRASKHLPSREDLNVNTKIAGNELIWKMLDDQALREQFAEEKPELVFQQSKEETRDLIRKIYQLLTGSPEYAAYIAVPGRDRSGEKGILEFILNDLLLANDTFISHLEENFTNWDDDGELVVQLLAGYIQKPGSIQFKQLLSPDKEQFAFSLLDTVIEKDEHLQSLIIPKLKNWDPERIALLDMILMKMGVAEFLYFETIPPKVTINEYIDLAKEYSTAQSGQFVNGILDNIHKELVQQGKMLKVDYKKGTS